MKISLYDYCQQTNRQELLEQWNTEKNGGLSPNNVGPGSTASVWWRCYKGHEWQTQVRNRSHGTGCPVCAGREVVTGINDLATTHPRLAADWHPTKNGSFTPKTISYGSKKKAWWRCGKGHEWEAKIISRSQGNGCPVCAGKTVIPGINDLASMHPHLAAQWHPTKNEKLRPDGVTPRSNRRVWWLCEKGHEWQAFVSHRTGVGSGCPYCTNRKVLPGFNDLATTQPRIAAQWHPTLNEGLTPEMLSYGSTKRVWWQCAEGHVWRAVVYSRTGPDKCDCPVCSGNVSKKKLAQYENLLTEAKRKSKIR